MPLSYRNYLAILKGCAWRAGIDPAKIRTHSGRSTKAMEFIEHQILHPEDGLTDAIMPNASAGAALIPLSHTVITIIK